MSKKKNETKSDSQFELDVALSNVNRYLLQGFKDWIKDEKVTTQRQFDKLYNDYKELK